MRRRALGWGPHRGRAARADVSGAASFLLKRIGFLMTRSHHLAPPAGPPPAVQDEIAAAWERAQAPVDGVYELAFSSNAALRRAWGELAWPDGTPALQLRAGDVGRLAAGAETTWTVTETLRKIYLT